MPINTEADLYHCYSYTVKLWLSCLTLDNKRNLPKTWSYSFIWDISHPITADHGKNLESAPYNKNKCWKKKSSVGCNNVIIFYSSLQFTRKFRFEVSVLVKMVPRSWNEGNLNTELTLEQGIKRGARKQQTSFWREELFHFGCIWVFEFNSHTIS